MPVTHHLPVSCDTEFAYWALKCKAVKALPCKWNTKSNPPFFLVCSTPKDPPRQKSVWPSGIAAIRIAAALVRCGFPLTMPRMGKVLGRWLILCARKCRDFEISCFASSWEAGNTKAKSICLGKRSSSVSLWDSVLWENIKLIFKAVMFLFSEGITCRR